MFSYSKFFSYLKLIRNNYCSKCLKHKSAKKVSAKEEDKYKNTVLLPKTDFPLWLNSCKRVENDEKILRECGFATLYNWQRENVTGPEYVLHDGPPYANGMPHMGHAINKILKDITTRHKLLQGHRIHYTPGWDCHGLPIELKAMAGEDYSNLSPLTIRKKARKFAKDAIKDQKAVFKSWGVMADWDNGCYFTFDKSYIKNELQKFLELYDQGIVYRDVKPVYWSPSSRTALAEAELEYNENHVSTAAHVRVQVTNAPEGWGEVYALLWTTTPWTLPANQAVAYSPSLAYSLVSIQKSQGLYLVASPLISQLASVLGREVTVAGNVDSSVLPTLCYNHPLYSGRSLPFLASSHVTADKGTGLVHIAPAHGPDDFKLAKKYNLPISCLVDEGGFYTEEASPELAGKAVLTEGSEKVIDLCQQRESLVGTNKFKHSYPYDWRTGQPIILRASQQWFFDTSLIKQHALDTLKEVKIVPERGTAGLLSQVQTRPFWCISRQRKWGVPIPVLYTSSGHPIISKELVEHYCHLLDTEGEDFWWSCPLSTLAPQDLVEKLNVDATGIERGQDILDIWLDSGLSWSAVLDCPTADLYLEGVDQFNGWFQSSLLTSVALQKVPPYKTVFVHGFAVDEKGMKMSKSIGNVVNPQNIVYGGQDTTKQPAYGIDTLRWWVAAHSTQQSNVPVSPATLNDSKVSVQRLRSLFRFLVGALHGLPACTSPPVLYLLDSYMLHCLHDLENQVMEHYNQFQYNRVCLTLVNFISNQVSSLYCHLTKDRLYCEEENSERRRAVQLVSYHILNTLTRLIAPIAPILAEEVYSYQPVKVTEYLFHKVGPVTRPEWCNTEVAAILQSALEVKQEVTQLSPLNCDHWQLAAIISAPTAHWELLKNLQSSEESSDSELAEILQISCVTLRHSPASIMDKCKVEVGLVDAHRCERCSNHTIDC